MEIPAEFASQLLPTDYVMPKIEIGNYFLEWDAGSGGLAPKEIPRLKHFIAEIAPYLTPVLFETIVGYNRLVRKSAKDRTSKITKSISPRILVSHKIGEVTYRLEMDADGRTIIRRVERLSASDTRRRAVDMHMEWKLGELHFNRQGSDGN